MCLSLLGHQLIRARKSRQINILTNLRKSSSGAIGPSAVTEYTIASILLTRKRPVRQFDLLTPRLRSYVPPVDFVRQWEAKDRVAGDPCNRQRLFHSLEGVYRRMKPPMTSNRPLSDCRDHLTNHLALARGRMWYLSRDGFTITLC